MAELKLKLLFLDTFNFSSDTRGHFSDVNTLLESLAIWSKKMPVRVIEGNMQEGSNFKA